MLSYTDLKPGRIFLLDGDPYKVLDYNLQKLQRSKPVAQTKIRNLKTGKVLERNFRQSDKFEEVEIDSRPITYIYSKGNEYWFHEKDKPAERFSLGTEIVGDTYKYLKERKDADLLSCNDDIIGLEVPIKMDFEVTEAPPGIKGDTAQGGNKEVTIETGYRLNVPLFVNEGDIIRINTETGEYSERANKK